MFSVPRAPEIRREVSVNLAEVIQRETGKKFPGGKSEKVFNQALVTGNYSLQHVNLEWLRRLGSNQGPSD